MVRPTKRIAAGAGVMAITVGSMLAFSPQAYAASASGQASCSVTPAGLEPTSTGTQQITVSVVSSAPTNQGVGVKVTMGATPATSPAPVQGVQMTPSMSFKSSDGSTVVIKGAQQTLNIQSGAPITPQPFTGDYTTPSTAGTITLTPVSMHADVVIPSMSLTLSVDCTYTGMTAAATIAVGGGSSSSSTPTATATDTSAASGANSTPSSAAPTALPKTGPMDDAVSMGLLGGTAGLLGIGAVLVATKRVRGSRAA